MAIAWQKHFLHSIGQLAMSNFFPAKCMFAMVQKRIQHTEFSFLPASKAIKAVSCITDFGVSLTIITFFVGDASFEL